MPFNFDGLYKKTHSEYTLMHVTNVAAAILLRNVKLGVSVLEFLMDEIMDEREVKKMAVIDSSIMAT